MMSFIVGMYNRYVQHNNGVFPVSGFLLNPPSKDCPPLALLLSPLFLHPPPAFLGLTRESVKRKEWARIYCSVFTVA